MSDRIDDLPKVLRKESRKAKEVMEKYSVMLQEMEDKQLKEEQIDELEKQIKVMEETKDVSDIKYAPASFDNLYLIPHGLSGELVLSIEDSKLSEPLRLEMYNKILGYISGDNMGTIRVQKVIDIILLVEKALIEMGTDKGQLVKIKLAEK